MVKAPPKLTPVPLRVRALVLVIVVPPKSRTAPLVILTALVFPPNAVALPIFRVPAEIVVPPV